VTQPLSPEVLAWLRQSVLVDGSTYSRALLHLLERLEALEADATEQSQSSLFCNEAIVRRLEALEQRPIPGSVELTAPTPEGAPVVTDQELADCYADAAKVAILNCRDYDKALTPVEVLKAQIRAIYNLGHQRGAAQPPDTLPARVLAMCRKRDWSLHWTCRIACLHLECSELAEAIRGKYGDPLSEAADVLLVLMSITENAGIPWGNVLAQTAVTCARLEVLEPYPGEERDTQPTQPAGGEATVPDSKMSAYDHSSSVRFAILDRLEKAIDFTSHGWRLTPEGEQWQLLMAEQAQDEQEMGL